VRKKNTTLLLEWRQTKNARAKRLVGGLVFENSQLKGVNQRKMSIKKREIGGVSKTSYPPVRF